MRPTPSRSKALLCVGFWLVPAFARAASPETIDTPILANLSFDQLSEISVTTASRTPERLWQAPAAVTVLTPEDIEASGATSVPEALRWVPGLNAAQITANTWAVGARGFQWQYANKLLVMVDGRSIYSPTIGGVRWEDQSVFLDDLDRIEVVRGPGSSVWGANAVNGVINIVSKSAFDTLGSHLVGGLGNELQAYAGLREGILVSDDLAVRIYGNYRQGDENILPAGGPAEDSFHHAQAGFRLDWTPSPNDQVTFQGDVYDQSTDYVRDLASFTSPTYSLHSTAPERGNGANVLGRWRHDWDDETYIEWRSYWDWHRLDRPQNVESIYTLDSELTAGKQLGARNEITGGLGFRYTAGELGSQVYAYSPDSLETRRFSVFLQDQIALVPDHLTLTVGSKLEHNTFTDWEVQPTARLSFAPNDTVTLWGSVARANRTPTWSEEVLNADVRIFPPGTLDPNLPASIRIVGNRDLASEKLTAYEAGFRWKPLPKVSVDVAGFYYDYDDYVMITYSSVTTQTLPPAQINSAQYINGITGSSYGGEAAVRWEPLDGWRLQASYSHVQIMLEASGSDPFEFERDEDTSPEHTVLLQSSMDFGHGWTLDLGGRHVSAVSYYSIPEYFELDARLAWRISENWQASIVGHNLLHASHAEYDSALFRRLTEIQRSVFLMLRWTY